MFESRDSNDRVPSQKSGLMPTMLRTPLTERGSYNYGSHGALSLLAQLIGVIAYLPPGTAAATTLDQHSHKGSVELAERGGYSLL